MSLLVIIFYDVFVFAYRIYAKYVKYKQRNVKWQ